MSALPDIARQRTGLDLAVDIACQRVAPTWPLDRFIAVNPSWGYVHQPMARAAAHLGALRGTRGLMATAFYREAWNNGDVQRSHLLEALSEMGVKETPEELIAGLERSDAGPARLPLLSDCVDAQRDLSHVMSWHEVITHEISQFCAARFDADQAHWHPSTGQGLYASWHARMLTDHGVAGLTGERRLAGRVGALPATSGAMLAHGVRQLAPPAGATPDYLTALLVSINGWAAWCAYRRWEARLAGTDDQQIEELLAIRLAWECLLDNGDRGPSSVHAAWARSWHDAPAFIESGLERQHTEWVWQRALELAYQRPLCEALARTCPSDTSRPSVQAVFCIDVRSECLRRALEAVTPGVRTLGFAGFFGLPLSYAPLGTAATRPQLPGLLSPALHVTDAWDDPSTQDSAVRARLAHLNQRDDWTQLESTPASIFTFVESFGLFYLPALLGALRGRHTTTGSLDSVGVPPALRDTRRNRLPADPADAPDFRIGLAARILRGMSLTEDFARLVLLVGHGSQSANNAHASGLDCGACCGQTGEVNARVLAGLLNEPDVRVGLRTSGIAIPDDTHFLAALHNTTTDEVELFDTDEAPVSHAGDVAALRVSLAVAGHRVRLERAPRLGLPTSDSPDRLLRRYRARATDWSQVRPEWGLAGNASFIVAPRARTRGLHLGGRAFLHEYDYRADGDGSVLELIMTAPMVVAHWINMQYFASVVDPDVFGSGNKLLHNVVGGRIGVFEGNGGDLRIGLPLQSVHDGTTWAHSPLRLSVFIEAPAASIDRVIAAHSTVRNLIEHEWLHLFQIAPGSPNLMSYRSGRWTALSRPMPTADFAAVPAASVNGTHP